MSWLLQWKVSKSIIDLNDQCIGFEDRLLPVVVISNTILSLSGQMFISFAEDRFYVRLFSNLE